MKTIPYAFAASLFVNLAWASDGHVPAPTAGPYVTSVTASWAEGEVRRVDRAQGRVTLRHGPIESLNMPPMTMVFRVQDPSWLVGLKIGEVIRFQAEQVNGSYTITRLERGRSP